MTARPPGALMVRGPWAVQRYFRGDEDVVDADGWFDTGDIATLDATASCASPTARRT